MLKFFYQLQQWTVLLSALCLFDIKENWIESFYLLDEENKVIEDGQEKGWVCTEA